VCCMPCNSRERSALSQGRSAFPSGHVRFAPELCSAIGAPISMIDICRKLSTNLQGEASHQSYSSSSQHGGSAARSLPSFPLARPLHDCAALPLLRLRSRMVFVGLQACLLCPVCTETFVILKPRKAKARAGYPFGTRLMGFLFLFL
jgi:hypothetical protein